MKYILAFVFLLSNPITFIADINEKQDLAQKAYQAQKYKEVIAHYLYLIKEQEIDNENIYINLANAYYNEKNWEGAFNFYQKASEKENAFLQSIAFSQMGLLLEIEQNHEEALVYFKDAILKDPLNFEARYNYELLKKRIQKEEKKYNSQKNQEQNTNQSKRNSNSQNIEDDENGNINNIEENENGNINRRRRQRIRGNDGNESEKIPSESGAELGNGNQEKGENINPEKLKEMKITRDKAINILEAMRIQEIQYIQQKKKKSKNVPSDEKKPNW